MKSTDSGSSYADEIKTEVVRPSWQMLKTNDALPPRALTVTSVTQSHDLQVLYKVSWGYGGGGGDGCTLLPKLYTVEPPRGYSLYEL